VKMLTERHGDGVEAKMQSGRVPGLLGPARRITPAQGARGG
jgi:hypothetical protein